MSKSTAKTLYLIIILITVVIISAFILYKLWPKIRRQSGSPPPPSPPQPFDVQLKGIVSENIVLNGSAPFTVKSMDPLTSKLNPGIEINTSQVTRLRLDKNCNVTITVVSPLELNYTYTYTLAEIENNTITYGDKEVHKWVFQAVEEQPVVYLYYTGFQIGVTNTVLSNFTTADTDNYLVIKLPKGESYQPIGYLQTGYSIPLRYVGAPRILTLTYTSGTKPSSPAAKPEYVKIVPDSWNTPAGMVPYQVNPLPQNSGGSIKIWYGLNGLSLATEDVIFFVGIGSCYVELHKTDKNKDLGPVSPLISMTEYSDTVVVPRSVLQKLNSTGIFFIPYGTAIQTGNSPPCPANSNCSLGCSVLVPVNQGFMVDNTTIVYNFYGQKV